VYLKLTIFDYPSNEILAERDRRRQVTIGKSFTESQAQTSAYNYDNIVNHIYVFSGHQRPVVRTSPWRSTTPGKASRRTPKMPSFPKTRQTSCGSNHNSKCKSRLTFFPSYYHVIRFSSFVKNFLLDQEKWNKSFAQTIQTTQQLSVAVATASERKYEKKKNLDR
jgi:hypothetical protein